MSIFIQQLVNGLIIGGVYGLIAVGLTTIYGLMDVVNFAHGEFYMLGGMIAFFIMQLTGANYFIAIAASVILVMCIGYICEKLLLKRLRDKKRTSSWLGPLSP